MATGIATTKRKKANAAKAVRGAGEAKIQGKIAGKKTAKKSKKLSQAEILARRNAYAAKFFPYIEKVARRLARRLPAHVELADLITSGVNGLVEAAGRFEPARG